MKVTVKKAFAQEILAADTAERASDLQAAFGRLERAHILGQRYFLPHMLSHVRMFRIAMLQRDGREIRGQLLRLFAVIPGYLSGWIPKGNTGGADVSPLRPMPVPDDLAPLLDDYDVWKDVRMRAMVFVMGIAIYFAWSSYAGPGPGSANDSAPPDRHAIAQATQQ